MAWNPPKMWTLAIASLVMYSDLINANFVVQNGNPNNNPKDVNQTSTSPFKPNARYQVEGGANLFLTADFLYWTAREMGLAYAIKDDQNTQPTPAHDSKVKQVPTEWHAGCKVGLGYNTNHDAWDLYFNWTHYQQHPTRHVHANSDDQIIASWMAPFFTRYYPQSAQAKWDLHFNSFDLEIGRTFAFSNYLALRPHLGVEGALINQDYDITYKNVPAGTESFRPFRNRTGFKKATIDVDNDFWGVGLRGGIDSLWKFNSNWGLYADASVAILWGMFKTSIKEKHLEITNGSAEENPIDDRDHFHTAKANLQFGVGLSWDEYFSDDRFHLALTLGWEEQVWFAQNQISRSDSFNINGQFFKEHSNLSLAGLTFGARFDF
jgi:hypothetical protein